MNLLDVGDEKKNFKVSMDGYYKCRIRGIFGSHGFGDRTRSIKVSNREEGENELKKAFLNEIRTLYGQTAICKFHINFTHEPIPDPNGKYCLGEDRFSVEELKKGIQEIKEIK